MPDRLVLWGPPVVDGDPNNPDYGQPPPSGGFPASPTPLAPPQTAAGRGNVPHRASLAAWTKQCADVGVTKIIGGDRSVALTEAAHQVGVKVDPYINYNSFPRHGTARLRVGWSLDFVRPPLTAAEARAIIDDHRPIYDNPQVTTTISDFAGRYPHYRSLTRDRSYALQPGQDLYLSPAFPEVRAEQTQIFVDTLLQSQGDGIQVEFVLGNEDENGCVPYGYDDRTVAEFQDKHGKDPFDLPNDDPDWLQFRADYVTLSLTEMRAAVKRAKPDAVFSITLIAGEKEDYPKLLHDWPAWIEQGLLDEFYIWFRTNSDLDALERQLAYAVQVSAGRTPVIAELSAYHPGSFQRPEQMLRAAEVAVGCGADGVGIYRTHAVEQLNFWPVLEKMRGL